MKGGLIRETPGSLKVLAAKAKEEERAQKFLLLLKGAGVPLPDREVRLHPVRKWKHDFVWSPARDSSQSRIPGVILESEGGLWTKGHNTGTAIENDIEKANELQLLGYLYLRVPSDQLATSKTVDLVIRARSLS